MKDNRKADRHRHADKQTNGTARGTKIEIQIFYL